MAAKSNDSPSPPAGLDHHVSIDARIGSASLRVPLPVSPGRGSFTPALALAYGSGSQNSIAGAGWRLDGFPSISLDIREGVPSYSGRDRYTLGGGESLVPQLDSAGSTLRTNETTDYRIDYYRDRFGQGGLRYERWTSKSTAETHWRTRDPSGVVTVFGRSPEHRIHDPDDSHRVFAWLVEARFDQSGDAIAYDYAEENGVGLDPTLPFEALRAGSGRFAQRYPKRIRYANSLPLSPDSSFPSGLVWHLEVVFDYGDHDDSSPTPQPDRPWPVRHDPYSGARSGFEVRSYRLLRRLLRFHRFDDLGTQPVCVGMVRLTHSERPDGSVLLGMSEEGRRTEGSTTSSLTRPGLTFRYSEPAVGEEFEALDPRSVENVPAGLSSGYRWTDLRGEGLAGILCQTPGAWYYKPNLGDGQFGPLERVSSAPSFRDGSFGLSDFDRDGNPNLGRLMGRDAGFFEFDRDARQWTGFETFASVPRVPSDAPVQWVDLNADGQPDLVIAHSTHFVWYPSLGRDGFDEPVTVPIPEVAGDGPPLFAEDPALRFFFADMTGDGLLDLVHVSNGRIQYWSHQGHGRFGQRVVMDGAPVFDHPGTFDPRRIRLTDLDGSGTSDLLYLGRGEIRIWTNASGNEWIDERSRSIPYIDDVAEVQVLDLLANGVPCLVWSSGLPQDAATPIQFLPLTDRIKPRLLLEVSNGLGRVSRLTYGHSAQHYLRDLNAGRDWISRLPSHVTVVDRHEEVDLIGGGRRVTRFEYHDGSFDGDERTFRGFSAVDQYDAEDFEGPGDAPSTYVEPTCIRTWFHDGTADRNGRPLSDAWSEDPGMLQLHPSELESPAIISADEYEQAFRSLAGLVLRQEVFASLDGTRRPHPLQVIQNTYQVRTVQREFGDWGSVFSAFRSERLDAEYGGEPTDPRVAHHVALEVDGRGVIQTEVDIAYPRRTTPPTGAEAQGALSAWATRTTVAHVDTPDRYVIGINVAGEEFEVLGLTSPASGPLTRAKLLTDLSPGFVSPLDVNDPNPSSGDVNLRRQTWERSYYWNDLRSAALPLGQIGAPLAVHHEETAVFTTALVQSVYGTRVDSSHLGTAGYVEVDGYWWRPGPEYRYGDADVFHRLEQEVAPDTGTTTFRYDTSGLFRTEIEDAFGNVSRSNIDYQALGISVSVDANGFAIETRFDALGRTVATSAHGEVRDGFGALQRYGSEPLSAHTPPAGATWADVLANPQGFLQQADRYVFEDADAYTRAGAPPVSVVLSREALVHDGEGGGTSGGAIQIVVTYYDGFGRVLQQKQNVEGGPAIQRTLGGEVQLDTDGVPILADVSDRWLVSGHVVYGNKAQPVRVHEPFHSPTAAYESDAVLRSLGVPSEHSYDALGRRVRTDLPNGTHTRTERTPWLERTFDPNDTVASSAYRLDRELLPATDPERQALDAALAHADTPTITHFDAMGQEVLLVESGLGGADRRTRQTFDAGGRLVAIVDPRGLTAFTYRHDMMGQTLYTDSVDAGERWTLHRFDGHPIDTWDSRGVHTETAYDLLARPTALHFEGAGQPRRMVERWTYGESLAPADSSERNARGRMIEHRDSTGLLAVEAFTPSGEPLRHSRRLRNVYTTEPDWTAPGSVPLEAEQWETRTRYDAMGRAIEQQTPDGATRQITFALSGGPTRILLTTAGGELVDEPILASGTYDARGRRSRARLGNDVQIDVDYDSRTHRMNRLRARRFASGPTQLYQDLRYTYDPVGNVLRVTDDAQQPATPNPEILQGLTVSSDATFTYDPYYRLTEATGRVHQALQEHDYRFGVTRPGSLKGTQHLTLNNGAAVERYTRTYSYDDSGNLTRIRHVAPSRNWTTDYWVSPTSNRRLPANDPSGLPVTAPESRFDAAGHLIDAPHLRVMTWNRRGELDTATIIDRSGSGDPDDVDRYVYDGNGQRRRKIEERWNGTVLERTEKLYLESCEIKRVWQGTSLILERHTTHVGDGVNRLATVHRWLRDNLNRETSGPGVRTHYQLSNHLGSAAVELNEVGGVISYEEFFPYGGSSFIAGDAVRDVRLKDYRYCGKERDDGTGFDYFGYRHYAPFIGGWLSPDPLGPVDGPNLYQFVRSNPVTLTDPNGLQSTGDFVPLTTVSPDANEAQAIRQANWNFAFSRGIRITDLEPTGDGNWLITGHRRLTPEEAARLSRVMEYLNSEDPALREVGELLQTWDEAFSVLDGIGESGDGDDGASADPAGADGAGAAPASGAGGGSQSDEEAPPGDPAGASGDTTAPSADGAAAGGEGGPSVDPGDPSAEAIHDANGDSTTSSGSGPREATGTDPNPRGLGRRGEGTGGGGPGEGRGTGNHGSGRGRGYAGAGRGGSSGGSGADGATPDAEGRAPGGGGIGASPGGRGDTSGAGEGDGDRPTDPNAPRGYDPNGSAEGLPGTPPDGYRPPPPGTQPGGMDPAGSPDGADGHVGDPNGASGQGGEPGGSTGGNEQGDSPPGNGTPPTRERDALDTLVDVASYITLDAFFGDDSQQGGDQNGIPGGMGLFDLNLGRWGQVAYVTLAAVDLVMTIISLGEIKAAMIGVRAALRTAVNQVRRLAPLARQAIRQGIRRIGTSIRSVYRSVLNRLDPRVSFFHGTSAEFAEAIRRSGIDLDFSRYGTDFGRGFYTAPTREGALASARRLYGEAAEIVEFSVPRRHLRRLSQLTFDGATPDWEDFVRFHRGLFSAGGVSRGPGRVPLGGSPLGPPRLLEHGGGSYTIL